MTTADEPHEGMTFLKALFGPSTTQSVYLCSLPNEKGEAGAGERSIADRDETVLTSFANRWDRDGRGLYFCVSTLLAGTRRNRENVLEVPALHVDIDFKSIKQNEEDAKAIVRGLVRLPPSAVVYSGHGLHAYWILKEALDAQENLDRVEGVLRQLADTFGGDLQVTHVAALMRLPGSHNTKGGQWWEVRYDLVERRYELDDVEEWLAEQSPVLTRKERPPKPPENPYLAIARTLMFKPALDVEERLSAMSYQGEGDASIHATQLAVSSSILSRGGDIDTVVEILLAATRAAAGEYGTRWNWAAEERNIRKMGATWLSKLAKKEAATQAAPAPIVDLGQAREARASKAKPAAQPKPATTSVAGKKFHLVAAATLAVLRQRGGDLLFENGQCWRYTDRRWHLEAEAKGWLNAEIEQAARGLGIVSDNRLVNEARGWIERNPDLARPGGWDEHGLVPTKSGLFDPRSGELVPAEPAHRVTWRVDAEYVPGAACPHWLQMLEDAFADREPAQRAAVIGTLQECLGAALIDVKPRGLRKALVFVGGTSSGKSQLLAVFGGMFGTGRIAQAIAAVDTPHGLMQFQRRAPWILDEAFNQSVWNLSATVKTLITGEAVPINVKYGPLIHHHFLGPIFWATNHPPQFKESTRAIVDRLVVIECRQHFGGGEPVGAAAKAHELGLSSPSDLVLAQEKPGVLAWALEGLRRALARGAIVIDAEAASAATQIYLDSNLVAGFVAECLDYDANGRVSMPDFCVAVACWFVENKGEDRRTPSNDAIGRALVALHDPMIVTDRKELRDNATRYLIGARLNSHGLEYHERGISADLFEGKTVQTTASGGSPNGMIPVSWDTKPTVVAMRALHSIGAKNRQKRSVTPGTGGDISEVSPGDEGHDDGSRSQVPPFSREPRF